MGYVKILSCRKYDSEEAAGPMQYASSASLTCCEAASASEKTATVEIPSRRQVRMIRQAISPRLAMRDLGRERLEEGLLDVGCDGGRVAVGDEQRLSKGRAGEDVRWVVCSFRATGVYRAASGKATQTRDGKPRLESRLRGAKHDERPCLGRDVVSA